MVEWEDKLSRICSECARPGWDSYGGVAVTPDAVFAARRFCETLNVVPTGRGGVMVSLAHESFSVEFDAEGHPHDFFLDTSGFYIEP